MSWIDEMVGDFFGLPGVNGFPYRANRRVLKAVELRQRARHEYHDRAQCDRLFRRVFGEVANAT
jgi:hypothetical protein